MTADSIIADAEERLDSTASKQPLLPNPDRRNPWFALLLSLMVPGLGLMYIGRLRMVIIYYLIFAGVVAAVTQTRFILEPLGFYIILISFLLWYLVMAFSSLIIGYRRRNVELRGYQRWYGYTAFIIAVIAILVTILLIRKEYLGYATYRMPSISMHPTIRTGEYILADTWAFEEAEPKRGQVVVFRDPRNHETLYIKRIIAQGGDSIAIRRGKLYINGKKISEDYLGKTNFRDARSLEMAKRRVPPGHYFVMGDNRDNSLDSRDLGTVPGDHIYARAMYIWYSVDKNRQIRKKRLAKSIY